MATANAIVKLLLIEPDAEFRRNLFQRLRREQWLVFEAAEDGQVKRLLQKHDMDVIVLNLKSLQQGGLTILRTIKSVRPLTEVILLTGAEQLSLAIAGMRLGAFDDLLLPFDMQTLLKRVLDAYAQRRARQSTLMPRAGGEGGEGGARRGLSVSPAEADAVRGQRKRRSPPGEEGHT